MFNFDLFSFFKKYPLLAVVILFGLAFVSGPKAWHGAQVEGYAPGLQTLSATVTETYERPYRSRYLGKEIACHVVSQNEGEQFDTRIDCDDKSEYEVGSIIELVRDGSDVNSLSFERGHFFIDALLLLAELFGVFYYFRLSRRKVVQLQG